MKVLILENENEKMENIKSVISINSESKYIKEAKNQTSFLKYIYQDKFDLIIVDIMVPYRDDDSEEHDISGDIINIFSDEDNINRQSKIVCLTRFDQKANENFKGFNQKDICILTYAENDEAWKSSLSSIISDLRKTVDFVIICALEKEAEAFSKVSNLSQESKSIEELRYKDIKIGEKIGAVVILPRMGLVSCAIHSTIAINLFRPKLICMSGICAGVSGKSNIYDIIIPDICYQHDSGKWGAEGFENEPYAIQINHSLKNSISSTIEHSNFKNKIKISITDLKKNEYPPHSEDFDFAIKLGPTSSGSAVIANNKTTEDITNQHRKLSAFEMETFALYESARVSSLEPLFFSVKSVVDNGTESKSDDFHRIACLLSAKVTAEIISSLYSNKVL